MLNENMQQENVICKLDGKKAMTQASVLFLIILLLQIPISVIVAFLIQGKTDGMRSLISILAVQGYMLVAALIFVFVTKRSFSQDLFLKKYRVSTFFLSIVMLITATPMANLLNIISQFFAKNETGAAIYNITETIPGWLAVCIIGCLPGFIEELIFRSVIHCSFRKHSILTGIIVSSISFGLMHMNFNQIMYAVYLGIIFALLVEATGSVISTMILHMLFNGVNTAYILVLPKIMDALAKISPGSAEIDIEKQLTQGVETSQLIAAAAIWTPFAVGGLVLTILLLKAIAKINGRELTWKKICEVNEENKDTKPINVCIIICWVICLFFSVLALFG